MFKFKISEISDGIFVFLASFITAFVISYYFLKNNVLSIVLSIPVGLIVFCAYTLIKRKKKGKLQIKREDEERFLKCLNALCFMSKAEWGNLVFTTLDRLGKSPAKVDFGIAYEENFVYVKFTYEQVSVGEIVKAYKKTPKSKNLIFIGTAFTAESQDFVAGFEKRIKLVPLSEFFPLMKKVNSLPDGGFIPKKKKAGFLTLLKGTFKKGKAKTYAFYGGFLLIMSNFVFYPLWYIISGSIFLIYAIAIKFFAPSPTEKDFL
ncbi:MAG: hypothetical protein IJY84_00730 [Clostridia bacterium]|nr:hypothetical protein [Clostridia bacterium]